MTDGGIRRVMGIDPGLANCGWALVDWDGSKYKLNRTGLIKTNKDKNRVKDTQGRILSITTQLRDMVYNDKVQLVVMEEYIYFGARAASASAMCKLEGWIAASIHYASQADLRLYGATSWRPLCGLPRTCKKPAVQELFKKAFRRIAPNEHEADAGIIALSGLKSLFGARVKIPTVEDENTTLV